MDAVPREAISVIKKTNFFNRLLYHSGRIGQKMPLIFFSISLIYHNFFLNMIQTVEIWSRVLCNSTHKYNKNHRITSM